MRWLIGAALFIMLIAAEAALGVRAAASLRDSTGSPAAGFLLVQWSAGRFVTLLICAAIGLALACAARLGGLRLTAALAAGAWVAGLASAMGGFRNMIASDGSVLPITIESLAWAGAVLLLALVFFDDRKTRPDSQRASGAVGRILMTSIGAAIAGAATPIVIWLLARSDMRGQTIAAAIIASIIVGLLGSFTEGRRGRVALFAVPPIAGALACAFAWWQHGTITLLDIGHGWTPFALVMPHDYAAGSLIGVTLGLAWSRAFMSSEDTTPHIASASDPAHGSRI